MRKPIDVVNDLVSKAEEYRAISYDYRIKTADQNARNAGKVGELVLRSSESDRELLKQLTSTDANSVRYPRYDYKPYIRDDKTKKVYIDLNFRYNRKRGPVLIKL